MTLMTTISLAGALLALVYTPVEVAARTFTVVNACPFTIWYVMYARLPVFKH